MLTTGTRSIGILGVLVTVLVILSGCTPPDASPFVPSDALEPIAGAVDVAEALAPIDNVDVVIDESDPPQVSLVVSSGLPNSCYEFDRYEVNQEGDEIAVNIFNIEKKFDVCAMVYTSVEHTIPLGSGFDPSKTYALTVNEFIDIFVVDELIAAAVQPEEDHPPMAEPLTPTAAPPTAAPPTVAPETEPVEPVDTPEPEPTSTPPTEPEPTVTPEPKPTTEASEPELVEAELGVPIEIQLGQTAVLQPDATLLEFVELMEDSRCPTGAVCAWAGQARVLFNVVSSGAAGMGEVELTLEAGDEAKAGPVVPGPLGLYQFEIMSLEPHPTVAEGDVVELGLPTVMIVVTAAEPVVSAPAAEATATPEAPEPPPPPTPEPVVISADCQVQISGLAYTVKYGDTLGDIAWRFGVDVNELAQANCLDDPTRIVAGTTIYVPSPLTGGAVPDDAIVFYLIIPGDDGQSGPAVGCGDSAVGVATSLIPTGDVEDDMATSLGQLFALDTSDYGKSGFSNSLYDSDLAVDDVSVDEGLAIVQLSGDLMQTGVCADARMEAQILFTIFQYDGFDSAFITVDGDNLKQLFDASGTVGPDEVYDREDVLF